jgi:hypothetical protein
MSIKFRLKEHLSFPVNRKAVTRQILRNAINYTLLFCCLLTIRNHSCDLCKISSYLLGMFYLIKNVSFNFLDKSRVKKIEAY